MCLLQLQLSIPCKLMIPVISGSDAFTNTFKRPGILAVKFIKGHRLIPKSKNKNKQNENKPKQNIRPGSFNKINNAISYFRNIKIEEWDTKQRTLETLSTELHLPLNFPYIILFNCPLFILKSKKEKFKFLPCAPLFCKNLYIMYREYPSFVTFSLIYPSNLSNPFLKYEKWQVYDMFLPMYIDIS